MSNFRPTVKFPVIYTFLDEGLSGAEKLLSHLAKPTNPDAMAVKLRNWDLWRTPGARTTHGRSRRQVETGMLAAWDGLRAAIEMGRRYQRSAPYHEGSWRDDPAKAALANWVGPVGDQDLTRWKNWLPVVHTAAAFSNEIDRQNLRSAFNGERSHGERISVVHHLLNEHDWMHGVIEEGFYFLVFALGTCGIQPAKGIRVFFSPNLQLPSAFSFAKTDPPTLN